MKQKQLEILLERVKGFPDAKVEMEQYFTPASIAAELLHFAYMQGDLKGVVYDLGCGTGILAIGAKLLGAEKVIGIDSDINALRIARENAKQLDVEVEFIACDVSHVRGSADTVVMNPPFGAQKKGSDRPFLNKALEIAKVVYSIHNAGSKQFIEEFIQGKARITHFKRMLFPLKRTFKFHKRDIERIEVELYRLERR
ncbi:MAG: METTL5 family protein [Methanocellales archaeon]